MLGVIEMKWKKDKCVLRKGQKGVSDVVANILILAITVTLFSTVFYWMSSLPSPEMQTRVDIQPSLDITGYNATGGTYEYTIAMEHRGGQAMRNWDAKILVVVTGVDLLGTERAYNLIFKISDSKTPIGDSFTTGKKWTYSFYVPTTPESTVMSVRFIDTTRGSTFWERTLPVTLLGGPQIVDKGIIVPDENKNWNPATTLKNNQKFKVYLKIFDPMGSVNRIYVNMSPYGGTVEEMEYSIFGDRYQTINELKIVGITNTTTREVVATIISKSSPAVQYTTIRITVVEQIVVDVQEYVDLGQVCTITWLGATNKSIGKEIVFSEDQPMTGEKILITASIRNIGNLAAKNATVTFHDATETTSDLIGSVSLSVPALGKVDAVIQYAFKTPGIHTVWVNVTNVDPPDRNPDITIGVHPGFRNLYVCRDIKVYVYYDDFEGSLDKWRHESTIARINGEGPLEYDNYSQKIDIVSEWDTSFSNIGPGNWTLVSGDYQSYPNSYGMTEWTVPMSGPIDVVLTIDRSGSMGTLFNGKPKMTWAKEAAIEFVNQLNKSKDRAALWSYSSTVTRNQVFTNNFTLVNNAINALVASGYTACYDAAALSDNYACVIGTPPVVGRADSAGAARSGAVKAQVHLTDGASNSDALFNLVSCRNLIADRWNTQKVRFFAIGLETDPNASYLKNLIDLANLGGGTVISPAPYSWGYSSTQYFYAPNPAALKDIYKQIGRILEDYSNSQQGIVDPVPVICGTHGTAVSPDATVKYYGNKSLVSKEFSLGGNQFYESAKLTFKHKYSLVGGSNGGVVLIGEKISGVWRWRYVNPQPTYTGNLNITSNFYDDNAMFPKQTANQRILYAFNGISGGGAFTWEHAEVDLTPFIPGNALNSPGKPALGNPIRVKFMYIYWAGGFNGGWWIDDVEVKVTRNESATPTSATKDIWTIVSGSPTLGTTHSGSRAWFNKMEDDKGNKLSIDNSLITTINLVNVKNATLEFFTRFNINQKDGMPPVGLRVEVSEDNGVHWRQINKGVRSGYGVSGTAPFSNDIGDGVADGKAWGGIHRAGDKSTVEWVPSTTLSRLNCDLSKWAGNVILLRFRVIVNNEPGYAPYQTSTVTHGIFIDDVVVFGNVTQKSGDPGRDRTASEIIPEPGASALFPDSENIHSQYIYVNSAELADETDTMARDAAAAPAMRFSNSGMKEAAVPTRNTPA